MGCGESKMNEDSTEAVAAPDATTAAGPATAVTPASTAAAPATKVAAATAAPAPVPEKPPAQADKTALPGIVTEEVLAAQADWAAAIVQISAVHKASGDFVATAADAAAELYAYGHSNVLFKPTKAAQHQFRHTAAGALSYFVGSANVSDGFEEDGGFAINGGKGWAACEFDNHAIDFAGGTAIAMGNYTFTCASTAAVAKVEYTFGYRRCDDGKLRIFVHHSSLPYAAAPTPQLTEADVLAVQAAWAQTIVRISQVHHEGGDYVQAAATAAGELYAYGHSNVLFKPTKAAQHQFRHTAAGALSYFVGSANVSDGFEEDGGFAINGGKGWAACEFDNHQIEVKSDVALAMGNYIFTCATSGARAKVEYTFGYQRCDDGNVRIFLHHSSVPYKP